MLLTQTEAVCSNPDMQQGLSLLRSLALRLPTWLGLPPTVWPPTAGAGAGAGAVHASVCASLQPAVILLAFGVIGAYVYCAELAQRRTFLLHTWGSCTAPAGCPRLATDTPPNLQPSTSAHSGPSCSASPTLAKQGSSSAACVPSLASGGTDPSSAAGAVALDPATVKHLLRCAKAASPLDYWLNFGLPAVLCMYVYMVVAWR